jgi:dTDP-4-amino-4,6-dideoxygalactose transaminase/predicted dehydrogenase
MKVAVVGLGYFGVHYVRISLEAPNAELVAVCDIVQANVTKFTSKHPQLKGYTDIDELLKLEGLEAVILITQASYHYKLAKKVLEAKKHLLIEKPFTTDAKQAVELTELARESGVTLLVGHTFLYNAGVQSTKNILESTGFGDLLYMYATRTNLGPFRHDVNAAWDLAPHDISIFQFLTGKVPSWVCAVGAKPLCVNNGGASPKINPEEAMEDVVFITMGYENTNLVSQIHVSWANPKKVRELTLVGTGMRVVFDDMDVGAHVKVFRTPVKGPGQQLPTESPTDDGSYQSFLSDGLAVGDTYCPAIRHAEPLKEQVFDFFRCAHERKQPISDARFGADVVRVLEAIQESVNLKGARVKVKSHESLIPSLKVNIPLVDLKANLARIKDEVKEAMMDVVDNTAFVLGPQVKRFEDNYAKWCGTTHCIGVNSGTDALFLALKFLDIGPGDEVITQANTFVASVLSISNVGATPVLVDHDDFFMIDTAKIEAKITPKTKAIMPVHLYGHMADMDTVLAIAKKHNLKVVEDASQGHGALYKGKRAGSMGDVGCFSFYPGKNLGAYGDGGAIVTNNAELATRIQWWRSWGAQKKYHHELKGGNSRLDTIQAVVVDTKLKYLDDWNAQRRKVADLYAKKLQGVGDLVLPKTPAETVPVWHLYVVRTAQRDELLKFLNDTGIGAGIHYPIPIHELGAYKEEMSGCIGELPATSANAPKLLSLPIFPELTEAQVDIVVDKCRAFFASPSSPPPAAA